MIYICLHMYITYFILIYAYIYIFIYIHVYYKLQFMKLIKTRPEKPESCMNRSNQSTHRAIIFRAEIRNLIKGMKTSERPCQASFKIDTTYPYPSRERDTWSRFQLKLANTSFFGAPNSRHPCRLKAYVRLTEIM